MKKAVRFKGNKKGAAAGIFAAALFLGLTGCADAGKNSSDSGIQAYYAGDYETAIYLFNQAITQEPKAVYYINRGMAQCAAGEYDEAIESFQTAVGKNPNSVNAYRGIGISYLLKKEYSAAIEAFNLALGNIKNQKSSMAYDILAYRAQAKSEGKDLDGAIADYETLISYEYEEEDMYLYLGYVYLKKDNINAALTAFQSSLNINQRDFEKYLNMIKALKTEGYLEQAQMVADTALSLTAKTIQETFYHGMINLEMDREKEAFTQFEQAYNAGYEEAGYYLGYCYELREDYEQAQQIYQKQLVTNPDSARLYNQLAVCCINQSDYKTSATFIKQGLTLDDPNVTPDLLWNQIICYERQRDYDTAIDLLAEYLKKYPEDADAASELSYLISR